MGWQGERGKNGRGWTQRRKNHNQSWEIMREIYWSLAPVPDTELLHLVEFPEGSEGLPSQ